MDRPTETDLRQILQERELRVQHQKQLLQVYGGSLICLTLNLAGPQKRWPLADRAFEEGCSRIEAWIQANRIPVSYADRRESPAGLSAYWCLKGDAQQIKHAMVALEESDALARLFDVDVMTAAGKLERRTVGAEPRRCFLCSQPAAECGRSRRHSVEQLQAYTHHVLHAYFDNQWAEKLSSQAVRALLYEVSAAPKPGLVDRWNCGAHSDMDFFTFLDSTAVLQPYFADCARIGAALSEKQPEQLLHRLQLRGAVAEQQMLAATGGVNTHKGAIFSLGLLCGAAGALGEEVGTDDICRLAGQMGTAALRSWKPEPTAQLTGGEEALTRYGLTGVRGEAASGFASVREIGLPLLRREIAAGRTCNEAGLQVLMALFSQIADTNVLRRKGKTTLERWQNEIQILMETGDLTKERLQQLDTQWSREGISPGGCADLLAITYFLWFLSKQ